VLFSVLGYFVLDMVYTKRISGFGELIRPLFGTRIGMVMEWASDLFLVCIFFTMTSGTSRLLCDMTGLPYLLCSALTAVLCMTTIMTDIKGIVLINSVIIPFMIAGIAFIGLYLIFGGKAVPVFISFGSARTLVDNWFVSSVLYAGYNGIISIVALSGMLPYLKTRETGKWGGILGGASLCALALIINTAIALFLPDSASYEIPIRGMLSDMSCYATAAYSVVLLFAMVLSAIITGHYAIKGLDSRVKTGQRLILAVLCALSVPVSTVGFSRLIANIYPLFGYIGVIISGAVFVYGIKRVARRLKEKII
jgi:uncharacterized membrane protein YkvI